MSLNTTRISPRGVSIVAWAPGYHVYGITVDNPSGWWLLISPGDYYVPPFTFGWRQYLNGVTSVSIRCVDGPGALQSQDIGNPITVVVSAAKVDNSAGYTTLGPGAITSDLIASGVIIVGSISHADTADLADLATLASEATHALDADTADQAALALLADLAESVSNVGATVIINASGITILNGFLSIADEFGATVLGASGFSGSWNAFVALGIYNGNFAAGTVGTVPNGRTSSLPYWTVSNVAGSPTLTFLSGGGVRYTWAAINTTKRILSDRVPILPGRAYNAGFATSWARGAGTITLTLTILWFKADGSAATTPSTTVLTETHASGAGGLPVLAQDYFAQAPADAYFAQYRLDGAETGSHSGTNKFEVYSAWINPLLQSTPYIYIDQLEVGRDSGLSAPSHFYGDITLDSTGSNLLVGSSGNYVKWGDVGMSRTTTKTVTVDDGSGGAATLRVNATLAVDTQINVGAMAVLSEPVDARLEMSSSGATEPRFAVTLSNGHAATASGVFVWNDGDTVARASLGKGASGVPGVFFGPGNAAADAAFYRAGTGVVRTLGRPTVDTNSIISPTALAGNTDDWNPTGLDTAAVIRVSSSAGAVNLTGITATAGNSMVLLCNVDTTDTITLVHDATSTAANRFLCPNNANLALRPRGSVWIFYDSVSSRWRVVGP